MHQADDLFFLNFHQSVMVPNVVIDIDTILRMMVFKLDGKPLDYFADKFKIDGIDEIENDLSVLAVTVEVKVNYFIIFNEQVHAFSVLDRNRQLHW